MRVVVDLGKCIKSGECCYNHPELFRVGEDDFPEVLVDELTTDSLRNHARQAAEVCPTEAISIEND